MHQSSRGEHENTVHEVLSDYGSNGLRLMRFLSEANRIEIRTWNALNQKLTQKTSIVPAAPQPQFELPYTMTVDAK